MGERFLFATLLLATVAQWQVLLTESRRLQSPMLTSAAHTPLLLQGALPSATRHSEDAQFDVEVLRPLVNYPRRSLLQPRSETSRSTTRGRGRNAMEGFTPERTDTPKNARNQGRGLSSCSSDDDDDGECETVDAVRQAFFGSCNTGSGGSCCRDLEEAGINDLEQCCMDRLCDDVSPFNGEPIIDDCDLEVTCSPE